MKEKYCLTLEIISKETTDIVNSRVYVVDIFIVYVRAYL